jgi:outer membrane protein, multidrug efflux system
VMEAQNRTLASSSQALNVARSRYDKGAVSYLDVTEAERTPLATERALAQLRGMQWAAAQLVKALGGGWGPRQLSEGLSACSRRTARRPGRLEARARGA